MKLLKFSTLSNLVERLVFEEYERRHGRVTFRRSKAPDPLPGIDPLTLAPKAELDAALDWNAAAKVNG